MLIVKYYYTSLQAVDGASSRFKRAASPPPAAAAYTDADNCVCPPGISLYLFTVGTFITIHAA